MSLLPPICLVTHAVMLIPGVGTRLGTIPASILGMILGMTGGTIPGTMAIMDTMATAIRGTAPGVGEATMAATIPIRTMCHTVVGEGTTRLALRIMVVSAAPAAVAWPTGVHTPIQQVRSAVAVRLEQPVQEAMAVHALAIPIQAL